MGADRPGSAFATVLEPYMHFASTCRVSALKEEVGTGTALRVALRTHTSACEPTLAHPAPLCFLPCTHCTHTQVLGIGLGVYNPANATGRYTSPSNTTAAPPQLRDTVTVPLGGWAAVRFVANNPGR